MTDSPDRRGREKAAPAPCRRDGWTPARQLRFLEVLRSTGNVSAAARAVGMSRESAHRLRRREPGGLFALSWARCFAPAVARTRAEFDKGHRLALARGFIPSAARPGARAALSNP